MSFFKPDRPLVRIASAGAVMIIGLGLAYVLWVLPSPCMTPFTTTRHGADPGLLAPADWSITSSSAPLDLHDVNPVTCPITVVLTLLLIWWCVERHRSWVEGRPHRMSGWFEPREKRRMRRGLCPLCNYDLRGDLAAGCPECGWNREDTKA